MKILNHNSCPFDHCERRNRDSSLRVFCPKSANTEWDLTGEKTILLAIPSLNNLINHIYSNLYCIGLFISWDKLSHRQTLFINNLKKGSDNAQLKLGTNEL